jgi:hypothetical protein
MLTELLWFILGAAMALVFNRVLKIRPALVMIKYINLAILSMMNSFSSAYDESLEMKYAALARALPIEKVAEERDRDFNLFQDWKHLSVQLFFNIYPKEYHDLLQFEDWNTAMEFLRRESRKNNWPIVKGRKNE